MFCRTSYLLFLMVFCLFHLHVRYDSYFTSLLIVFFWPYILPSSSGLFQVKIYNSFHFFIFYFFTPDTWASGGILFLICLHFIFCVCFIYPWKYAELPSLGVQTSVERHAGPSVQTPGKWDCSWHSVRSEGLMVFPKQNWRAVCSPWCERSAGQLWLPAADTPLRTGSMGNILLIFCWV